MPFIKIYDLLGWAEHWSYAANSYKKQLMLDYVVAAYGKPAACKQVIWHHEWYHRNIILHSC
jgi:ABC-type microcin C transport system permease subunit YejB